MTLELGSRASNAALSRDLLGRWITLTQPDLAEVQVLLGVGTALSTCKVLYPEAFEPEAGLELLAALMRQTDVRALNRLLDKHYDPIKDGWHAHVFGGKSVAQAGAAAIEWQAILWKLTDRADYKQLLGAIEKACAERKFELEPKLHWTPPHQRPRYVANLLKVAVYFKTLLERIDQMDAAHAWEVLDLTGNLVLLLEGADAEDAKGAFAD